MQGEEEASAAELKINMSNDSEIQNEFQRQREKESFLNACAH